MLKYNIFCDWFLLDNDVPPTEQSSDGFLNFTSIRIEDSGWYKCITRYQLAEYSSIGYFLNVRGKYIFMVIIGSTIRSLEMKIIEKFLHKKFIIRIIKLDFMVRSSRSKLLWNCGDSESMSRPVMARENLNVGSIEKLLIFISWDVMIYIVYLY